MADKQVKVILQGEDKTGDSFKAVGLKLKGLNTEVGGLAKTLAGGVVAGGVALTAFLVSSANAAADAEVAMARVDATLKAMGSSAIANKQAILDAADAAVKLGFDDEDAAESITKLYQRTNDLTEANKLNSLAMDLARAKNIELSQAADLVGQVLSGNSRVLKQYGIDLDESKTPLQALGELQGTVAGQAVQFSETWEGKMQSLSILFGNLKETVGAALIDAIKPFLDTLVAWASKKETQQKIQEIGRAVKEWADVILPVAIETIRLWWVGLTKVVEVFEKIGEKINAVIEKIRQLNAEFGKNQSKNGTLGAVAQYVNSGINSLLGIDGARANGGPVMGGGRYLVGERGPEIFTPSSSGMITANGAGGIVINITGNQLLDQSAGEKIAAQIMDVLRMNNRI